MYKLKLNRIFIRNGFLFFFFLSLIIYTNTIFCFSLVLLSFMLTTSNSIQCICLNLWIKVLIIFHDFSSFLVHFDFVLFLSIFLRHKVIAFQLLHTKNIWMNIVYVAHEKCKTMQLGLLINYISSYWKGITLSFVCIFFAYFSIENLFIINFCHLIHLSWYGNVYQFADFSSISFTINKQFYHPL